MLYPFLYVDPGDFTTITLSDTRPFEVADVKRTGKYIYSNI